MDLIDTQWNVNEDGWFRANQGEIDLIDTQWNVNKLKPQLKLMATFDLIDTQWNVNSGVTYMGYEVSSRFNRYIVECKYHPAQTSSAAEPDLIDTQWNVNEITYSVLREAKRKI